jgi:hypothetical protein
MSRTFEYTIKADYGYDALGEPMRDDLEDLIEFATGNISVKVIATFSDGEIQEMTYDIPVNTNYDYLGESVRDQFEDRMNENQGDIKFVIMVVY